MTEAELDNFNIRKSVLIKKCIQLEKENADLQKSHQDLYNSMRVIKDQRNKAKEIIKGLLSFVDSLGNYSGGIFAKAKQFLNEVEK